jgi:hypothetical protein
VHQRTISTELKAITRWGTGFALLSKHQSRRTALLEAHVGNQALELLLPKGFMILNRQQSQGTVHPEAYVGNWAPELLLPKGLGLTIGLHSPKPVQEIRPRNFHCMQALFSWVGRSAIGMRSLRLCRKSGPITTTAHRLCSPE